MLGKGLESLIPPNQGKGGQGQNQNQNPKPGQGAGSNNNGTNNNPRPAALPSAPHEDMLPAAPEPAAPLPLLREFETPSRSPSPAQQQPAPSQSRPQQQAQPQVQHPQPHQQKPQPIISSSQRPVMKKQEEASQESIFQIEIEKIRPNPDQPRRNFNQEALHDMANSIREFGILQPLILTKVEKESLNGIDVEYEIIAGERRFMASKIAGLHFVPAIVRNINLEREKLELGVIENIQRENLNPIETARAFQRLQEEFRMTQREIAAKLGKSREVVANAVRLLDLPEYIRQSVEQGAITESSARLLLGVEDAGAQKNLFEEILNKKLTTRDIKERVQYVGKRRGRPPLDEASIPPEMRAMQEELSSALGAPVQISKGQNTGRITITFYSEEELENILRRLGKEER